MNATAWWVKQSVMLKIGACEPSLLSVHEVSYGLAHYAVVWQDNSLFPILEPKIMVGEPYGIKRFDVTELVLAACYKALSDHHVLLECTFLKTKMVAPGLDFAKVAPRVMAEHTVRAWLSHQFEASLSSSPTVGPWWQGFGFNDYWKRGVLGKHFISQILIQLKRDVAEGTTWEEAVKNVRSEFQFPKLRLEDKSVFLVGSNVRTQNKNMGSKRQ